MRAAVLALLVLPACAMSTSQHALVAVTLSEGLSAVGDAINREMAEDAEAAGGEHAPEAAKLALDAQWDPVIETYESVARAHSAYVKAIRAADKAGDASLLQAPARAFLSAWSQVEDIGDRLGIAVPPAPSKLVKFVEGL